MTTAAAGAQAPADATAAASTPNRSGSPAGDTAQTAGATQTPEQKAAADAAAKEVADKATAAATATAAAAAGGTKAPATYALTVPTEATEFITTEDLTYLETLARENDWTNDEAQAELASEATRLGARVAAQSAKWAATTKADAEYGGDHLASTQTLAKAAIARVRPEGHPRRDGFLAFMNRGGAGNHIEVVSFLADLGKLMGEDAPGRTGSSASASGGTDTASKFYDHATSRALDKAATP